MRALKLDYRRHTPWLQWAGWAALLLAALVAGWQGWHYRQLAHAVDARQAEVDRLAGALDPARRVRGAPQHVEAEMRRARDVLRSLSLPWAALFTAVESATDKEVALLGIEPEPERRQVRIIGEAKTYLAVLEYVRRLEDSAPLAGVHLQSHQVQAQDPERPVRFVLGAAWGEQ